MNPSSFPVSSPESSSQPASIVDSAPPFAAGAASGARPLFPIFLKLWGRRVLVVGGGKIAVSKVETLLGTGAELTVVAPRIRPELERPGIRIHRRAFHPLDLDGVWLVIAASTGEVNRRVAAAAEEQRVFVNAVDDPEAGSAYTGGVLRRGGVTFAISTEGQAPALAGLLREALEAVLPEELDSWIAQAQWLREQWRAGAIPIPRRRPLLLEALNQLYAHHSTLAAAELLTQFDSSGGAGVGHQSPPALQGEKALGKEATP